MIVPILGRATKGQCHVGNPGYFGCLYMDTTNLLTVSIQFCLLIFKLTTAFLKWSTVNPRNAITVSHLIVRTSPSSGRVPGVKIYEKDEPVGGR